MNNDLDAAALAAISRRVRAARRTDALIVVGVGLIAALLATAYLTT